MNDGVADFWRALPLLDVDASVDGFDGDASAPGSHKSFHLAPDPLALLHSDTELAGDISVERLRVYLGVGFRGYS